MVKVIFQHFIGVFLLLSFMLAMPQLAGATEEYAKQTGQSCSVCHLDPHGGGELTPAGKSFAESRHAKTANPEKGIFVRGFRLVIGYIHFLTGIFWFGTILYVHLILKPAYAASGLPRGEQRVGVISMIVMGITGSILTYYRISSFDSLFHTHFGILLFIKICLYLVMVLSAIFVISVIGPKLKAKKKEPALSAAANELTLEDLAACDGHDGRPAYFAFEGKIYDATQSSLWKQGVHMGRHNAGNDLTKALNDAPHGREKVTAMTPVGELVADSLRKAPLHERVFFFMAHMNLTIVFIIVLILALWRWG
ncbi:MAG: cytochrome b5 domain-containing protein [Desulfuromonadaceae bacterium]|nr:cytochrome b5 domain-containing protein [Desulfuromonadaceae bacterium]